MATAPNPRDLVVLGIETSCDETAAALVRREASGKGVILANVVRSQLALHAEFGGVVPEIAARPCRAARCSDRRGADRSSSRLRRVDGVAATAGPGLIGGLIVGVTTGKAIALARGLPFIAVNHLEAHALTPVSPMACAFLSPAARLRRTRSFSSSKTSANTRASAPPWTMRLARLSTRRRSCSASTIPAAPPSRRQPSAAAQPSLCRAPCTGGRSHSRGTQDRAPPRGDEARAAQRPRRRRSLRELPGGCGRCRQRPHAARHGALCRCARERCAKALVVAGGVAANQRLRAALAEVATEQGFTLILPPLDLCTDNAAMVAWAGAERLARGLVDDLAAPSRARWPLDPDAAPALGAGVKA